ncbi:hypothetical protein [Mongoliibacter ruber]|uniref:Uncharacterized protein n=1 Tax=Mongoliibacter ruber TaxID=1750599 RepID=A0A2T0WV91_9BACT|nr:hypothetical protein [Mongoliibacter ruber]PRY90608.1 hypothetical protein CLW00_101272 [Mongoliibacter ruber]
MDKSIQLSNLKAQLEAKRKKVLEDPDIPSQRLDQLTKEMTALFTEIQQLEAEVYPDNEQSENHHTR